MAVHARFDVAQFKEALPEAAPFNVSRYPLPNLRAVNFVVHGILGWGVASNLRLDTQAKGLAELLRSRQVVVPSTLLRGRKAGRTSVDSGTEQSLLHLKARIPPQNATCDIRVIP